MHKSLSFLITLALLFCAGCDSADDSFDLTETKILAQIPVMDHTYITSASNRVEVYGATPDGHAFVGIKEVTGGAQNDPDVSTSLYIYSIEGGEPIEVDRTDKPINLGVWYTSYASKQRTLYYLQRPVSFGANVTCALYSVTASGNERKVSDAPCNYFAISSSGGAVATVTKDQVPTIWSKSVGGSGSDAGVRLSGTDEWSYIPPAAIPGTEQFVVPGFVGSDDSERVSHLSIVSADNTFRQRIFERPGDFYGVSVSPSGQIAAFTSDSGIAFVNLQNGETRNQQVRLDADYAPVRVQFTPDSKNIFASCSNGHICLLDIATGQLTDVTPDEPEADVQLNVTNAWPTPDGRAFFYTVRTRNFWQLKVRPMP